MDICSSIIFWCLIHLGKDCDFLAGKNIKELLDS